MNVALFGATGGTGLEVLRQLLDSGSGVQRVTSLVRDKRKLPEDLASQEALQVVQGSSTVEGDVASAVAGANVVIVSLGGPPKGPGVDLCSVSQRLINDAVSKSNPDAKVVVVSSIGVGDHYQHCGLFAKFFASWIIPEALKDKHIQEQLCRDQLKNWIIVRPGGLVDTPGTGKWKAAVDACGIYPTIPRADVASFIVKECLPASSSWLHQSVALVS